MKMIRCFFLLGIAGILFSCKTPKDRSKNDAKNQATEEKQEQVIAEEPLSPDAPMETQILGTWQWTKTICCGRTPHTETAESLKAPKILKFMADGTLQYFSGADKTADQTYKITYGLGHDDQRPLITIGAKQPALLSITGDSMVIDYGYFDLQTEFFVRSK